MLPASEPPRRLVLWRHGRTSWNRLGIAQGHANVALDEVGRAQAERAAPYLASYEPVFIWSSDLMRARQTAEYLAALTERDVVLDSRLREVDVGVRQGMTFEQFRSAYPDLLPAAGRGDAPDGERPRPATRQLSAHRVPGAEDAAHVRARMVSVLSEATDTLGAGETAVLVGHGASLRTGLLAFFGVPDQLREMLAGMANCAWAVLEQRHNRGWQIIDYNAQTLPEPLELADDLDSP
jgi:glucosyl-3-phosphoglycerate phosphatase